MNRDFTGVKDGVFYKKGTRIIGSNSDYNIFECPDCHGEGKSGSAIYIDVWDNNSWCPSDNKKTTVLEQPDCKKCYGRGFLESRLR